MPRRLLFLGLLLIIPVAGLAAMLDRPAQAAFPGLNGKIAFQSDRDGNLEIYVMNADGSNQTRLTSNSAIDGEPAWSPDGTSIVFWSDRDGNREMYKMNQFGSRKTLLAHNDLTRHREVVAFSSGGILNRPLVTEGRSPINREGIAQVRELFKVQDERMNTALLKLTERLEKLEQWDPDTQVRLTHHDV